AADTEVRATRLDAVRRCLQHLDGLRLVEVAAATDDARQHAFTGQGILDEHDLAFMAGDAARLMAEIVDVQFDGRRIPARGSGSCVQGVGLSMKNETPRPSGRGALDSTR